MLGAVIRYIQKDKGESFYKHKVKYTTIITFNPNK